MFGDFLNKTNVCFAHCRSFCLFPVSGGIGGQYTYLQQPFLTEIRMLPGMPQLPLYCRKRMNEEDLSYGTYERCQHEEGVAGTKSNKKDESFHSVYWGCSKSGSPGFVTTWKFARSEKRQFNWFPIARCLWK